MLGHVKRTRRLGNDSFNNKGFLSDRKMAAKVGSVFSSERNVPGGSPQGSILGNLLFTLTTDGLTRDIEYNKTRGDCAPAAVDSINIVIDPNLARIITDSDSEFGINHISIEADDSDSAQTYPFEENGITMDLQPSVTSTPTTRGQFEKFNPPGNLNNNDLNGSYDSLSGDTFVYMQGMRKNTPLFMSSLESSTDNSSSPTLLPESESGSERDGGRRGVVPLTYIDNTYGIEQLRMDQGEKLISEKKTETKIRARASEDFLRIVRERSKKIGMKLNDKKTQLLCINACTTENVNSYIKIDNETIMSQDSLKILGFTFGRHPNVNIHFKKMIKKVQSRSWIIRNLKRSGFKAEDLVRV